MWKCVPFRWHSFSSTILHAQPSEKFTSQKCRTVCLIQAPPPPPLRVRSVKNITICRTVCETYAMTKITWSVCECIYVCVWENINFRRISHFWAASDITICNFIISLDEYANWFERFFFLPAVNWYTWFYLRLCWVEKKIRNKLKV